MSDSKSYQPPAYQPPAYQPPAYQPYPTQNPSLNATPSNLNVNNINSIPAYLKIANIVLSLVAAIAAGWIRFINLNGQPEFFQFVASTCLIIHLNFILFYIFRVIYRFPQIPWNGIQLGVDIAYALLFLLASSLLADLSRRYINVRNLTAAAVFGFILIVLHVAEAAIFITLWKRKLINFGATPVNIPNSGGLPSPTPNQTQNEGGMVVTVGFCVIL